MTTIATWLLEHGRLNGWRQVGSVIMAWPVICDHCDCEIVSPMDVAQLLASPMHEGGWFVRCRSCYLRLLELERFR